MNRRLPEVSLSRSTRAGHGMVLLALLLVAVQETVAAEGGLPAAPPETAGMDGAVLEEIDAVVAEGIDEGQMPGCVVLVGRQGKIVFSAAYGHRQLEPEPLPMELDTVFDLASLTKPIATATSVMILIEQGKLGLDDRVAEHLPEFDRADKREITVYHLLTHQSGLPPANPLSHFDEGPQRAWERLCELPLRHEPGARFVYSDVGYLVLGELVHRMGGAPLDAFAREHLFAPLGMAETGFLPDEALRRRAAPTERREDRWMVGEVHDPRAYLLEGVAGHAGLFATAADLAVYAQMLLGGGEYGGRRILRPETVALMTEGYPAAGGKRGLGWDVRSGYSTNRGRGFSPRAFGHGGFTGTSLWIDPERELFVLFLSNRLHPHGKGSVNPLAARIGSLAARAVAEQRGEVLAGIDVLAADGYRPLAGRRVGLITNHTGVDREGTSTARRLHEAPEVNLVALFSPEHGIEGQLDVSRIDDTRDPETGLVVYSLYGATRRPTEEMLSQVDCLVFDIQDIGARFYTYISTMGMAMETAAEHGVAFVVLDRPNPIGGVEVAGPILDAGRESFVGFHTLPVRHGMTVGELALLFRAERGWDLDLSVVRTEGWRRSMLFDETGLAWINPSPNMRSLAAALLYPGIGLLEFTNISVGRGTATPFEHFGAPWLDGVALAEALQERQLPGIAFCGVEFTPDASVFAGEPCQGVAMTITDREAFDPVRTGLIIALQLRADYPESWNPERYDRLLTNRQVYEAVLAGKSIEEIEALYRPDLARFLQRRAAFLLYR